MVRGLFTDLRFPYAQFPCIEVSGDQLFSLVWNAVSRLENMGFTVLALCCDGLAANHSLLRLHDVGSKIPMHKVVNLYAHDGTKRNLFFILDPPHLMKTVRNCWANPKQMLWCNGMEVSWKHLN